MLRNFSRWILTPLGPSWACGTCGSTYDTHDEASDCHPPKH
jgi:hypothetical protein